MNDVLSASHGLSWRKSQSNDVISKVHHRSACLLWKSVNDSASGFLLPQANASHTCQWSSSSVQSFGPEGQGQESSEHSFTENRSQVRYRLFLQDASPTASSPRKRGVTPTTTPFKWLFTTFNISPSLHLILLSLYNTLILSIVSVVSDPLSRFHRRRQFNFLMLRISTR